MSDGTTIAAIASPPGPARRGILRLSGPATRALLRATVPDFPPDSPRTALRSRFDDGVGRQPLLLLWMPAPRSYTREDVAELHLPGNPALLDRALARLLALGATPASAGEFTRRAFLNGRIDLTRAEGVLELVQASDEGERRAATHLLAGGLDERVGALRDALDDVRALRVLLHGAPNAGKSTLFNALVGHALAGGRALVSDHAGTTRDGLEALWGVGRGSCLLRDGPGLDAGARGADAAAQRLASRERGAADLILWVIDAARVAPALLRVERAGFGDEIPAVVAWNQIDRGEAPGEPGPDVREHLGAAPWVGVSARTGAGLEGLERAVARSLGLSDQRGAARDAGGTGLARELFARHRAALQDAAGHVGAARAALVEPGALDLVAEGLRAATAAIDGIRGRTTPEDLLDRIFARFCIGK